MVRSIQINVHGIKTNILSDECAFLRFVQENYLFFVERLNSKPNVLVEFSLGLKNYLQKAKKDLVHYGEGLYLNKGTLYWENEFGFAVEVKFVKYDYWEIKGFHFNLLEKQSKEEELKNYMRSMRWMIHFPIFSMLEKFHKMRLVHATAVAKSGRAVILAGLNKVGKSSIGRYLYEYYGYNYLSDNFLLTNKRKVFAFPEKGRLDPDSVKNLDIMPDESQVIYGKYHFSIPTTRVDSAANPQVVFIVGNAEKLCITKINHLKGITMLENLHRYLKEFPEYTFYSILDSFDFWGRTEKRPLFSSSTKFFQISIPLDWSINETAREIIKCI